MIFDSSASYARLSDIAKKDLLHVGSMTLHSTPAEYCLNMEYLSEEDILQVNAEVRSQRKSFGNILDFPLAAFAMGKLTEEQTIDAITHFKTIEIVPSAIVRAAKVKFDTFRYEYCKKRRFFEYVTDDPDDHCFFVSITDYQVFSDSVKRYIPIYRSRVALPGVIDEMLDKANTLCGEKNI